MFRQKRRSSATLPGYSGRTDICCSEEPKRLSISTTHSNGLNRSNRGFISWRPGLTDDFGRYDLDSTELENALPIEISESLVAAVRTAIGEMASAEVNIELVSQSANYQSAGDIAAVVEFQSAKPGYLVLSFLEGTASAL